MTDIDPRLEAVAKALEATTGTMEWGGLHMSWANEIHCHARRLCAFDQAQPEIVRNDNYHAGELAERACWIIRRRDGELVHEEALKRIEMLMDAKGDTRAREELDLLTTLVQFYERKPRKEVMPHKPDGQSNVPGDNATAPVMGADPPWLDDACIAARVAWYGRPDNGDWADLPGDMRNYWRAQTRAVLAFANAQPPSNAEIISTTDILRQFARRIPVDDSDVDAAQRILIAAAKVRSGAQ